MRRIDGGKDGRMDRRMDATSYGLKNEKSEITIRTSENKLKKKKTQNENQNRYIPKPKTKTEPKTKTTLRIPLQVLMAASPLSPSPA